MPNHTPLCIVIGVGFGNGAALVGKFAKAGYRVAMIARSRPVMAELESFFADCHGYVCDAGDPAALTACLADIAAAHGVADVLIYNAGKGVWGDALSVSAEEFEGAWRTNTLGSYAAARAVLPAMVERGAGGDRVHRCHRVATRRGQVGRLRGRQGGAAQSRGIARPGLRPGWGPRRADRG